MVPSSLWCRAEREAALDGTSVPISFAVRPLGVIRWDDPSRALAAIPANA